MNPEKFFVNNKLFKIKLEKKVRMLNSTIEKSLSRVKLSYCDYSQV